MSTQLKVRLISAAPSCVAVDFIFDCDPHYFRAANNRQSDSCDNLRAKRYRRVGVWACRRLAGHTAKTSKSVRFASSGLNKLGSVPAPLNPNCSHACTPTRPHADTPIRLSYLPTRIIWPSGLRAPPVFSTLIAKAAADSMGAVGWKLARINPSLGTAKIPALTGCAIFGSITHN